jgi:hypothetical protein
MLSTVYQQKDRMLSHRSQTINELMGNAIEITV